MIIIIIIIIGDWRYGGGIEGKGERAKMMMSYFSHNI